MKKSALITSLISLSFWMQAQPQNDGGNVGIKASASLFMADIKGAKEKFMPGASVGIFSNAPLSDRFYIQPELNVIFTNTELEFAHEAGTEKTYLNLWFADLSVSGLFYLSETVEIHAGLWTDYLFKSSPEVKNDDEARPVFDFAKRNFNDLHAGILYGAAKEFKRFDIGIQYRNSFTKLGKSTLDENPNYLRTKSNLFMLYVAYIL